MVAPVLCGKDAFVIVAYDSSALSLLWKHNFVKGERGEEHGHALVYSYLLKTEPLSYY